MVVQRSVLAFLLGSVCVILSPGFVRAATTPYQSQPPVSDVQVTPDEGPPGTIFSFYAAGFQRLEEVHYWATAPDGSVDAATAGNDTADDIGRARWNWAAPQGAQPGRWLMVAYAPRSGIQQLIPFVLTPEGTPTQPIDPPAAGVRPEVGPPGIRFVFFAEGFAPEERIAFWGNGPDGKVDPTVAGQTIALADGRAEWSWTTTATTRPGPWTMVARGLSSGTERVIGVMVR